METIQISNYSCNDKGIVSNTENISNVVDKLIRLTAKLTECYASDIIYDIEALNDAVKNGNELDRLLFFRECGVTTYRMETFDAETLDKFSRCFTFIQVWRLTHNPSEKETKLIRVSIHKEGF